MEKNSPQLTVLTTFSASARPQATAAWSGRVVLAAPAARHEGTAMYFGGATADVTPRVRINPSGTTTWGPPV